MENNCKNILNNNIEFEIELLNNIKSSSDPILKELKEKIDNSSDISDKVFYLNRYSDTVENIDKTINNIIKNIQQLNQTQELSNIDKISIDSKNGNEINNVASESVSPEQINEILKILNNQTRIWQFGGE